MPSIDKTVHSGQRRSSPPSHSPRNQCLPWLTRRTETLHKLLQQRSRIDAPESWPLASDTTCLFQFRKLRRRASLKLSRWQSWKLWWQVRVLSPGRVPRVHETTNGSPPCRPSTLSAFRKCTRQSATLSHPSATYSTPIAHTKRHGERSLLPKYDPKSIWRNSPHICFARPSHGWFWRNPEEGHTILSTARQLFSVTTDTFWSRSKPFSSMIW